MKILDFLKNKKLDTEVASRRKISTIEQELLDRCKYGIRINPEKDYSHACGYRTIVSGEHSEAFGVNNEPYRNGFIEKFMVTIDRKDDERNV